VLAGGQAEQRLGGGWTRLEGWRAIGWQFLPAAAAGCKGLAEGCLLCLAGTHLQDAFVVLQPCASQCLLAHPAVLLACPFAGTRRRRRPSCAQPARPATGSTECEPLLHQAQLAALSQLHFVHERAPGRWLPLLACGLAKQLPPAHPPSFNSSLNHLPPSPPAGT